MALSSSRRTHIRLGVKFISVGRTLADKEENDHDFKKQTGLWHRLGREERLLSKHEDVSLDSQLSGQKPGMATYPAC